MVAWRSAWLGHQLGSDVLVVGRVKRTYVQGESQQQASFVNLDLHKVSVSEQALLVGWPNKRSSLPLKATPAAAKCVRGGAPGRPQPDDVYTLCGRAEPSTPGSSLMPSIGLQNIAFAVLMKRGVGEAYKHACTRELEPPLSWLAPSCEAEQ